MTIDRALKPKGAGAAVLLAIMISVSGCASTTIEEAAPAPIAGPAGQTGEALPVPPPARTTGRAAEYPNLAETRRTAAPQFSDQERASSADTLRARRSSMADTVRDPIRDQTEFLRQIGRTHGDDTLRRIEAR